MDETEGNGSLFLGLFVAIVGVICLVLKVTTPGFVLVTLGGVIAAFGAVTKRGVQQRIAEEKRRLAAFHAEQHQLREAEHKRALELAAASGKTVEKHHHVVERQVVVMRCKYCSKLTPVDLKACESCGHQI